MIPDNPYAIVLFDVSPFDYSRINRALGKERGKLVCESTIVCFYSGGYRMELYQRSVVVDWLKRQNMRRYKTMFMCPDRYIEFMKERGVS